MQIVIDYIFSIITNPAVQGFGIGFFFGFKVAAYFHFKDIKYNKEIKARCDDLQPYELGYEKIFNVTFNIKSNKLISWNCYHLNINTLICDKSNKECPLVYKYIRKPFIRKCKDYFSLLPHKQS